MIFQAAPLPPPHDMGSAKRNFPFLRENLKRHEVSVLSFGSPEDEQQFRKHYGGKCKHIRFVKNKRPRFINYLHRIFLFLTGQSTFMLFKRRKFQQAIDEITAIEKFDLIHCCYAMYGFHKLPEGIPLVGDTHNVEADLLYHLYKKTNNILLKVYYYQAYITGRKVEINSLKKFDALTATTENDFEKFRQDIPEIPMYVIQNGVDPSFYEPTGVEPEPKMIVYMGLMSWYPNDHAIHYFLDNIFPLILAKEPGARLLIVGANPSKKLLDHTSERVIVTGYVDDVRPHVARGEVFIIPLLIGSGIRGKALESMAMRIPIVSTTLGCAGIHLEHEKSVLLADTPEQFAESVLRMFNNTELRKRIADSAFSIVRSRYDWTQKGVELENVYQSVLKRREIILPAFCTNQVSSNIDQ